MKKLVMLGILMTIAGLAVAAPQKKTFTARVKTRPAPPPPVTKLSAPRGRPASAKQR